MMFIMCLGLLRNEKRHHDGGDEDEEEEEADNADKWPDNIDHLTFAQSLVEDSLNRFEIVLPTHFN